MLGDYAEKGLSTLFGLGEYQEGLAEELGVKQEEIAMSKNTPEVNSLVEPVSTNDVVPLMHMDKEGHVRLTRREFVRNVDIDLTANPVITNLKINPGVSADFPWLSGIATSFEKYAFVGLAAEYVPTSGYAVSGTSAALGTVAMAFKYDVSNPSGWPITSLTGLLNYNGAVSTSPAAPAVCYMECDPAFTTQPVRLVQTESIAAGALSVQNTIAADLLIIAQGAPGDYTCGQLWLTYDVVLMNPRTIRPPAPLKELAETELGRYYMSIYDRYYALLNCPGNYTEMDVVIREAQLERYKRELQSEQCRSLLEKIRYKQALAGQPDPVKGIPEDVRDILEMGRMSLETSPDTTTTPDKKTLLSRFTK